MRGDRPDPNAEYHDWEYPDPEEIEELANRPYDEEPSASKGRLGSGLLKVFAGLMIAAFLGSLLLPVLGPLTGGGDRQATSPDNAALDYQVWIESSVSVALAESGMIGQADLLGVQLDDSIQDPIVGILADVPGTRSSTNRTALQGSSIAILQRLFADDRAQSVTLAWFQTAPSSDGGQAARVVTLLVGMFRWTAEGIDWSQLAAEDLWRVADQYQEAAPFQETL